MLSISADQNRQFWEKWEFLTIKFLPQNENVSNYMKFSLFIETTNLRQSKSCTDVFISDKIKKESDKESNPFKGEICH